MTFNAAIRNILAPAVAIVKPTMTIVAKPSSRTYYLGTNGRVSQRKRLVGEVLATVRAYSTNMAWSLFKKAYYNLRKVEPNMPEPFIGQSTTCVQCGATCGHTYHHTAVNKVQKTGTVCHVCMNWNHIGQQIVAGEAEA